MSTVRTSVPLACRSVIKSSRAPAAGLLDGEKTPLVTTDATRTSWRRSTCPCSQTPTVKPNCVALDSVTTSSCTRASSVPAVKREKTRARYEPFPIFACLCVSHSMPSFLIDFHDRETEAVRWCANRLARGTWLVSSVGALVAANTTYLASTWKSASIRTGSKRTWTTRLALLSFAGAGSTLHPSYQHI